MSKRRVMVAGNWKMNTTRPDAVALAKAVGAAGVPEDRDIVVFPPACFLTDVKTALGGSGVKLGAQRMDPNDAGARTGEISGPMLTSLDVHYVLCGHSERRHIFGESSDDVGAQVRAAIHHGLTPVLCVGETLDDREAEATEAVVGEQLDRGLADLGPTQIAATVIAYEPVWAIGTGRTASPEQAQSVHAFIRRRLAALADQATADGTQILYGGSVKPKNAADLLAQPDIDGALVGGASLSADSFAAIGRA